MQIPAVSSERAHEADAAAMPFNEIAMARLTRSQVRAITEGLEDQYPPVLTYEQAARLVQVQLPTLKGWLSQGRFARCVKRGKPGRIVRDLFLMEFLRAGN